MTLRPLHRGTRAAALLLGSLAWSCCTESGDRYATHERQIEARTEGEVELRYAWLDAASLLVVAPLHAASGRSAFSEARLEALTRADGPRQWIAVSVWRFPAPAAPLPLGSDGIPVVATLPAGSVRSLPPSKLLAAVDDPGARPVIAALAGAGPLPELAPGQSLQLVAALPTEAALPEAADVAVELPTGVVRLERARAAAIAWDEFRSGPSREKFAALLGASPADVAAGGTEGARGDEHDGDR